MFNVSQSIPLPLPRRVAYWRSLLRDGERLHDERALEELRAALRDAIAVIEIELNTPAKNRK